MTPHLSQRVQRPLLRSAVAEAAEAAAEALPALSLSPVKKPAAAAAAALTLMGPPRPSKAPLMPPARAVVVVARRGAATGLAAAAQPQPAVVAADCALRFLVFLGRGGGLWGGVSGTFGQELGAGGARAFAAQGRGPSRRAEARARARERDLCKRSEGGENALLISRAPLQPPA